MGKYSVETKNGVVLTSPNVKEIIEELSHMKEDEAIKFTYFKDNGIQILFDTMTDMVVSKSL
jgi:hypothetical protein